MHWGGLLRSDPWRVAHRLGAHAHPDINLALGAGIKGAADLGQFLPPRFDQGSTETCWAHSLAAAIYCARAAKLEPLPWVPSPCEIASLGYADVRAQAFPSGPLPELVDTGAQLQDGADAVARWGICPMGQPVEGRWSDVPSTSPFPEPNPQQIETARPLGGEYSIPVDSNAPTLCAASLDADIPVWLGTLVGPVFQALAPDDIGQPEPSGPNTGGHAMYLSAYRSAGPALQFRCENSWGSWGSRWVSEAFIRACWELWPCAIS